MRTLLVVTRQLSLASAIQAVLDEAEFQLITKAEVSEAEALLARGVVDVAILDAVQTDARAIRAIEEIRSHDETCPVIVYVATKDWECLIQFARRFRSASAQECLSTSCI